MSYANGTTHYNLPQTVGTDKRDWFDTNAAFAALDAALYAAATGQASDAEAITALQQTVAGQATDIAALQTASSSHAASISALQTAVNGQATQIADVRQDAEDMITANNEGAAATSTRAYEVGDRFIYNDVLYNATAPIAIGDTIVPNTNCEATNVDTELTKLNSDLGDITDATLLHTFTNADIKGAHISNLTGSIYLKNNQLIINFKFYGNTDSTNGFVALTNNISVGSLPSSINGIIKPAGVREVIDHDNERHVGVACAAQFGSNYMYLIGSPIQLKNGDIYQDQIIIDLI